MQVGRGRMFEHGYGNGIRIHPRGSVSATGIMCFSGWSVGQVRGDTGCIDEIGELARNGEGFRFPDVVVNEVDQFTEDSELKLKLDTIDGPFEHGLHDVIVPILSNQQADVHDDNK